MFNPAKLDTLHMPTLRDLIKLKKPERISKYMPRRRIPRPVPWKYNKDDILFTYGYVQCDAVFNRQTEGNLLCKENLRALNDSLWGWRQESTINQVHVYANNSYVKGENLWFPKKPVPKVEDVDDDSFKFQIQPTVPFSSATNGAKIFSNGISPIEIFRGRLSLEKARDTLANAYATAHLLASYSKHLVVWLDGHACGAGAGAFLHAPFVVGTERSCIEFPETGYGFVPSAGAIFWFARRNPSLGKYLLFTGERMSGGDLHHAGLVPYYVESANSDLLMADLKDKFEKVPVLHAIMQNYAESHEIPPYSLEPFQQSIESCFSKPALSEIYDSLAQIRREHANSMIRSWAEKTSSQMSTKSQLSLHLVNELFNRASDEAMPIMNAFQLEFMKSHSLFENINEKFVQNVPLTQPVDDAGMASLLAKYFERPEMHVPLFFHTKFNFAHYPMMANVKHIV